MTGAPPLLMVRDLEKVRSSADSRFALFVPDFSLSPGDRLALIGASGSGKSTLLSLLALAMRPDRGGQFLIHPPRSRAVINILAQWDKGRDDRLTGLRRTLFGYVRQTGGLLPFLSVEENLALPQILCRRPNRAWIATLADRLGLSPLLKRRPASLSVGQRQRVSIARALSHRPSLILADEPTASLDRDNAVEVMRLLVEQTADQGIALVIATHDVPLSQRFGFREVPAHQDPGGWTVFSCAASPPLPPAPPPAQALAAAPPPAAGPTPADRGGARLS